MADSSNDTQIVLSSIGFLIVISVLLNLAGVGTAQDVQIPSNPAPTEANAEAGIDQPFFTAVLECVLTLFGDCSSKTESRFFSAIADVFSFALQSFFFLFQLLTFTIPEIPFWLNAMIILPPAAGLAFVGFKVIRGVS